MLIKKFPASRQFTLDIGKLGMQKHHIKALLEIDVTKSRQKLKKIRQSTGKKISLLSWILKCVAQAVKEYPEIHALRKGRNKLAIFNEIDISVMIEKKSGNDLVPIPLVIRNAGCKSMEELNEEIDLGKKEDLNGKFVVGKKGGKTLIQLFSYLPQFFRLLIWKLLLAKPKRVKKMMGTVLVTSVGMFGRINGWFIPYSVHPLSFGIGSVIKKPGFDHGEISIREYLHLTILIDHDVIDGAPAARFIKRLSELIENGDCH